MTRDEAVDTLNSHLGQIRQLGVDRIGLFGSIARAEESVDSDIDILVHFAKGKKTFDNLMELRFYLEKLFPGRSIDLVLEESLKPKIQAYVSKDVVYVS